jgi:flagellar protein FliO/FliZ
MMALSVMIARLAPVPLWLALACGGIAAGAYADTAADAHAAADAGVAATAAADPAPSAAAPADEGADAPQAVEPAQRPGSAAMAPVGERQPFTGAPVTGQGAPVSAVGTGNLVLGLLFLLLLVIGAWWLVRRMGGLQFHGGAGAMQVLAALPVGPRERVVLVSVGGQQLLLGVAPGRVSLLMKLEEPLETATAGGDFASRLRQLMQQGMGR